MTAEVSSLASHRLGRCSGSRWPLRGFDHSRCSDRPFPVHVDHEAGMANHCLVDRPDRAVRVFLSADSLEGEGFRDLDAAGRIPHELPRELVVAEKRRQRKNVKAQNDQCVCSGKATRMKLLLNGDYFLSLLSTFMISGARFLSSRRWAAASDSTSVPPAVVNLT